MTAATGIYRIDVPADGGLAIAANPASDGDAGARIAEFAAAGVKRVCSACSRKPSWSKRIP